MGNEWGSGNERDALADIVATLDLLAEKLHRLRDSLRHPPRTVRARDLKPGHVVAHYGSRATVSSVEPLLAQRRIAVTFAEAGSTVFRFMPDAEIALAHPHTTACYGPNLEPVCGVTS